MRYNNLVAFVLFGIQIFCTKIYVKCGWFLFCLFVLNVLNIPSVQIGFNL